MDATGAEVGLAVRRRARLLTGAILAFVALVALLVAGWVVVSAQRAAAVHVLLPAGSLSCDGTSVRIQDLSALYGDDVPAPVAEMTEQMRCTLGIRIENRSTSDVTLEQVFLPVLGPQGGAGVRVVALDGLGLEPREHEVDAIFDFERPHTISAGSADVFGAIFEWQPDGCTSAGGTMSFPEQPTVTVRVMGRSHHVSFRGTGFGFRGSSATDCSL